MANDSPPLHVAIIGGGLCGLALAIALEQRHISYTIYESRESFAEIGAGINLAPNAIRSFDAIDPRLGKDIFKLATQNPPGREDLWMTFRLGAPSKAFEDGHLIGEIYAPPTGSMTLSRNELLLFLARSVPSDRTQFNKKLVGTKQSSDKVTLIFADGTTDVASIAIGCDGAHSVARGEVLGTDSPANTPEFSHTGGYRAVFSMAQHEQAVGFDRAHTSQVYAGPRGYVIMYPINGGKNMNIGLWMKHEESWTGHSWVLKNQKERMLEDLKNWGPTVQRVMSMMSDETEFWATFLHAVHPEHYFKGRLCIIGDSAHSMPPHQGQGASQAMEDVCVMASVLERLNELKNPNTEQVQAAYLGFEAARKERFEKVGITSHEAHDFWSEVWREDATEEHLAEVMRAAKERWGWLWNADIDGQQRVAVAEMNRLIDTLDRPHLNGTS